MPLVITTETRDGGDGYSKLVVISLAANAPDTEANLLVVEKAAASSESLTASVAELVAVASPEDLELYDAAETYPGPYRTNSVTMAFPSTTAMTGALAELLADLRSAATAVRQSYLEDETVVISASASLTGSVPYSA